MCVCSHLVSPACGALFKLKPFPRKGCNFQGGHKHTQKQTKTHGNTTIRRLLITSPHSPFTPYSRPIADYLSLSIRCWLLAPLIRPLLITPPPPFAAYVCDMVVLVCVRVCLACVCVCVCLNALYLRTNALGMQWQNHERRTRPRKRVIQDGTHTLIYSHKQEEWLWVKTLLGKTSPRVGKRTSLQNFHIIFFS